MRMKEHYWQEQKDQQPPAEPEQPAICAAMGRHLESVAEGVAA